MSLESLRKTIAAKKANSQNNNFRQSCENVLYAKGLKVRESGVIDSDKVTLFGGAIWAYECDGDNGHYMITCIHNLNLSSPEDIESLADLFNNFINYYALADIDAFVILTNVSISQDILDELRLRLLALTVVCIAIHRSVPAFEIWNGENVIFHNDGYHADDEEPVVNIEKASDEESEETQYNAIRITEDGPVPVHVEDIWSKYPMQV